MKQLELSSTGRIFLWLGVTLSIFGAVFTNAAAVGSAIVVFLYLLYEGLSFRRIVNAAAGSLDTETVPSEQETRAMRPVSFATILTNRSEMKLDLLDARRILPVGVSERQSNKTTPYILNPRGQLSLRCEIEAKNIGNFVISELRLTLGSRRALFLDHILLQDQFCLVAKPTAVKVTHPIDTDSLTDLVHDESRRGTGTDFAGLRPATYLDNYRQVDWKAVARFGKLFTREFYLDEEPAVMLMVDVSLLAGVAGSLILEGLHELISNIRVASPLGLLLYDSRSIVTTILPRRGVKHKEKIIQALLQNHGTDQAKKHHVPPQLGHSNEVRSLSNLTAYESATKPYLKRLGLFARTMLPFYSYAESKRSDRLREQGSYLGFKIIASLSDRVLVVAIADGGSNVEGLVEGAKCAVNSNHGVALVLLSVDQANLIEVSKMTSHLRRVTIARSTPRNLVRTVNAEILEMGHKRSI